MGSGDESGRSGLRVSKGVFRSSKARLGVLVGVGGAAILIALAWVVRMETPKADTPSVSANTSFTPPPAEEGPRAASLSPDQLRSEIARLTRKRDALIDSPEAPPEWKTLLAVEKKGRKLEKKYSKELRTLHTRNEELREKPGFHSWYARVDAVNQRLQELQSEDVRRAHKGGRELMVSRHRELEELAIDTPRARELGFDVLTYPRIDGSTSTDPLAALIACHCFQLEYEWAPVSRFQTHVQYGTSSYLEWNTFLPRVYESEYDLAEFTLRAKVKEDRADRVAAIVNKLLLGNASTHLAYVNVIEGKSDLALLARGPSPDERTLAQTKNVQLDVVPFALDAFVFIVNERNPVKALTSAQIRDIYCGKIKSWKDVGGSDGPIRALQRERNSGSQELMRDLVMKDLAVEEWSEDTGPDGHTDRDSQLIVPGMGGVFNALQREEKGLAYSVYYYEHYMAGSANTRVIAVDGVEPSYETIRTRAYPYTTEVLLVSRKDLPADAPASRLRDWLLSAEGQAVVRESGYVPIAGGG